MAANRTNKLTCIVTGKKLIATKEYYARKVEKSGGEEELHRTYICREAKNMIKQGTSVDRVRESLDVNDDGLQDVPQDVIDEILQSNTRTNFRRINNLVSINSMMNTSTDPEVREYIDRLKKQ